MDLIISSPCFPRVNCICCTLFTGIWWDGTFEKTEKVICDRMSDIPQEIQHICFHWCQRQNNYKLKCNADRRGERINDYGRGRLTSKGSVGMWRSPRGLFQQRPHTVKFFPGNLYKHQASLVKLPEKPRCWADYSPLHLSQTHMRPRLLA